MRKRRGRSWRVEGGGGGRGGGGVDGEGGGDGGEGGEGSRKTARQTNKVTKTRHSYFILYIFCSALCFCDLSRGITLHLQTQFELTRKIEFAIFFSSSNVQMYSKISVTIF